MRKTIINIMTFLLAIILVFQTCTIVLADKETDEAVEPVAEETDAIVDDLPEETVSIEDVKDLPEYEFSFETIAKNNEAELLIDKSVNALRLVSKSGEYFDTKVLNGQVGNDFIKNMQKSDFIISYYADKVKGNTVTLDNYSTSVVLGQVEYTPIENGIRCRFIVGDSSKIELSMFPMYISKDRLEELVLKHLDDKEITELLGESGYYTELRDKYIRNWGPDKPVAIPKLKRMYNLFYEIGKYAEDDLAIDNELWGVEETGSNITMTVVVDYLLDGKDLVVRVPVGEIVTDDRHPVSDLTLTPYLMSGDIFDEGYLFVPDGSGGIINFNSGKTFARPVSIPMYGHDILRNAHFYSETFLQSTLPVIGIKKNHIAVLGIIEEGAELATITANISGKMDEFNKSSVKFDLFYMEKMPLTDGGGYYMPKYANKPYGGNITMRYKLLEGENANYTGMAKEYKQYLRQGGNLKENTISEEAPLFVDMVASVPKEKTFMGIPYIEYKSMTSFSQAEDILRTLKSEGINNIVFQYTDWANGGVINTPLTKIKVINSIGGKNGLTELLSYTKEEGISFFPTIKMLTTYSTKGINKNKNITCLLNNTKAKMPNFEMVTRVTMGTREWLISPTFLPEYAEKILEGIDKLGIENIAMANAGSLLYGDYKKTRQVMRIDATPLFREALSKMGQEHNLLFSNANSYAYAYAGYIADLPTYSSGVRAIDYSVPFVQMVLENDIPYSMEAFNDGSIQEFERYLLKAIETKSNLKWIFTHEAEKEFGEAYLMSWRFRMKPYFRVRFDRWKDKIGDYYNAYNTFYQKVKDSEIKNHEVLNDDMVKVEYTNGITVYINYGEKTQTVDGQEISPLTHTIKE